jgi:transcriptional regulator with XRE-family HTH domain
VHECVQNDTPIGRTAKLSPAEKSALKAFRKRLRALREQRGWSYGEAERVSGVTRSHWRKLEIGPTEPQLVSLLRLQRAFGLSSLEALFSELPPNPTQALLGLNEGDEDQA